MWSVWCVFDCCSWSDGVCDTDKDGVVCDDGEGGTGSNANDDRLPRENRLSVRRARNDMDLARPPSPMVIDDDDDDGVCDMTLGSRSEV